MKQNQCDACGQWYGNVTNHQGYDFCWSCLGVLPESLRRAKRGWRNLYIFFSVSIFFILCNVVFIVYLLRNWPK